jgi:RimJ/RimL family protein N-acetyltransferase
MTKLRDVTINDAALLFEWANEADVRNNATNPRPIVWNEHVAWLTCKLSDDAVHMNILVGSQGNIGIIRFEKSSDGFIISYSIDKKYRGSGFGTIILEKGMENLNKIVINPVFLGYVKKGNIASEKIFNKFGFTLKSNEIINNIEFNIYKK